MARLTEHPTMKRFHELASSPREQAQPFILDCTRLRRQALDCGADNAGLVEFRRPGLDPHGDEIFSNYSWTKSLLSLVVCVAREPVRGGALVGGYLEFHRAGHRENEFCAAIVARLEARGVRAANPSMGFPWRCIRLRAMASGWSRISPSRSKPGSATWFHRNLIHLRFGNFVLLGTVLMEGEAGDYDHPIDYNPCLECKLCVAACAVGAIRPDGEGYILACQAKVSGDVKVVA